MSLDPSKRRPWEPSLQTQEALKRAQIENRRESVAELDMQGYSARAIARALKVSHTLVQKDLVVIRQARMLDNVGSLTDRLQTSIARRQRLYSEAMAILGDKRALNKDKITAQEQAAKRLDEIDALEGTQSPDKVTTAALAELYSVFVRIVAQANPEQQNLYQELLKQELAGSPVGRALLGSAEAYDYADFTGEDDSDQDDFDELEDAGGVVESTVEASAELEPEPIDQETQEVQEDAAGADPDPQL